MYKMIAIDLDDTLLTDQLIISRGTIEAIQQAVDAGIVVTIATGRMYSSAKKIARSLDLNVPLITYQGALVKEANGEDIHYERLIDPETAHQLIEFAKYEDLHLQVYQDDTLYSSSENKLLQQYANDVKVPYVIEPDLAKLAGRGFDKMLFIDAPDYLDKLQDELRSLFGQRAHITKSRPFYLEITHPEANKGLALLHLAGRLGIDRSEIIGIGDSYNDLDLIMSAGLGVAMGNAVDELKKQADYVTYSNNEEGVRHVIEKFIFQNELTAVKSG
ncbi:HAD family phosphatase [Siminovitchia acidinfaciens]|uniref:HAD family phosphatase n=1 Tax=Siminovitchia acidinfaciens TaxID=2321395 RepID=A0A429XZN0_9BACI|nr:Cof-type HAD-IIB family hydrolase [Siminovitchia acidinfaciens]RST74242.1 HAD family phosphatase [Siminovitchia acidinfaciens]